METAALKKFAQAARRDLMKQVANKLSRVLAADSAARRENPGAITKLEADIQQSSQDAIIEKVAYIWFNRFCALRFMDVNRYTRVGIVSPDEGQSQPEVLAEAKQGHIDEEAVPAKVRQRVFDLLGGRQPSPDPQAEAYRLLLVAGCNEWNQSMPFLFERIDDYTELLLPDDLLSDQSILTQVQLAMTPEACQDVEVIGWLYQFYISEKKDEVFDGLKKNKKITPENIPAATQLFTPHWIVRYLVENSLGRLWLLNRPNSRLAEQMEYYIKPEQPETDFLKINNPEEIKICDPACGSGHMLVYAFDLLYAIYEEEGYESADIPGKILANNLYGIEIDERAGELAAFSLTMKARSRQRRFFRKAVQPNICVLQNVNFTPKELKEYMAEIGQDLFTMQLQNTLHQFEEADNFGSLIRPELTNVDETRKLLGAKHMSGHLFLQQTHDKVLRVLEQVDFLSPKYYVVVANPPYMSGNGMNGQLSKWVKDKYPNSKSDIFATFVERCVDLANTNGMVAMITMQSWMFLTSFENLRINLLKRNTILTMAHLGTRAFDSIGGEVVSTTSFVIQKGIKPQFKGYYLRLIDGDSESQKANMLRQSIQDPLCNWLYRASADDLGKVPGSPISYWVTHKILDLFKEEAIDKYCFAGFGIKTGNNDLFMRYWFEVSKVNICFNSTGKNLSKKWYPCASGGTFRRWYGSLELIVNYQNGGSDIEKYAQQNGNSYGFNGRKYYFRKSITWPKLSSGINSFRSTPPGNIFDGVGLSAFFKDDVTYFKSLQFLNSKVISNILPIIAPTLSLTSGDFLKLPYLWKGKLSNVVGERLISIAKSDWDSFEISWDFNNHPLLNQGYLDEFLFSTYQSLRLTGKTIIQEAQRLEQENNRIFIEAYGLQNELTPDVPLSEITLTCNPYYRYGANKSDAELEALLLADTMREFISYAVGCMFGRYALDKPGLILANQGETLEDYLKQIPEPVFPADSDNVIPILDGEWFADDIVERFRVFLKLTFGEAHFQENLQFIEDAIGKDIRKFFLKDFYSDHLKRYKKRPIYWLFSSPKGTFNALIYMHRYRPDTVSIVLNKYLREFREKLNNRVEYLRRVETSADAARGEKTRALKEIEELRKSIAELDTWERNVLYPLATEQIKIDLDDGVKVNYPKFGAALKKIPGLDAAED